MLEKKIFLMYRKCVGLSVLVSGGLVDVMGGIGDYEKGGLASNINTWNKKSLHLSTIK